MEITWEPCAIGYIAFRAGHKLAELTTKFEDGTVKNGQVVYQALPADQRTLRFTSAVMHVDDVKALIASLPTV